MLREILWALRQRWKLNQLEARPVLDAVEFGTTRCVILDVGANRGGFAGGILLRAPLSEVHCFEPNQELAAKLRRRAVGFGRFRGRPRCFVNAVAVGSEPSVQELIRTRMDGASSLLPVSAACLAGWPQVDFSEQDRQPVKVIRLDEYLRRLQISRVKLLKLDVQGFELEALRGCGLLLPSVEYVLTEVQFQPLYERAPLWDELVSFLRPVGFDPVLMDGFCFAPDGKPLQADLLLINRLARDAGYHG